MPTRSYVNGERTKELFTGKERDDETGWDYFGARYYSPAIGRWVSVDPYTNLSPDLTPYHSTHIYPINRFDPDGRADKSAIAKYNFYFLIYGSMAIVSVGGMVAAGTLEGASSYSFETDTSTWLEMNHFY